jgi:hypothetical protein
MAYEHVNLLVLHAMQKLEAEELEEALGLLQKASDEITQLAAINKQCAMTGGGRPYRKAMPA